MAISSEIQPCPFQREQTPLGSKMGFPEVLDVTRKQGVERAGGGRGRGPEVRREPRDEHGGHCWGESAEQHSAGCWRQAGERGVGVRRCTLGKFVIQ